MKKEGERRNNELVIGSGVICIKQGWAMKKEGERRNNELVIGIGVICNKQGWAMKKVGERRNNELVIGSGVICNKQGWAIKKEGGYQYVYSIKQEDLGGVDLVQHIKGLSILDSFG